MTKRGIVGLLGYLLILLIMALPGIEQAKTVISLDMISNIYNSFGLSEIDKYHYSYPDQSIVYQFANKYLGKGTCLTFRESGFSYYTNMKIISGYDLRLAKAYKIKDEEKLRRYLFDDLGVRYIHVPNYSSPNIYNSSMIELITNPACARLVAQDKNNSLYVLSPETDLFEEGKLVYTSNKNNTEWTIVNSAFKKKAAKSFELKNNIGRTILFQGCGTPFDVPVVNAHTQVLSGDANYNFKMSVKGKGYLLAWLVTFPVEGKMASGGYSLISLWNGPVTKNTKMIGGQFHLNHRCVFRPLIMLQDEGGITFDNLVIEQLDSSGIDATLNDDDKLNFTCFKDSRYFDCTATVLGHELIHFIEGGLVALYTGCGSYRIPPLVYKRRFAGNEADFSELPQKRDDLKIDLSVMGTGSLDCSLITYDEHGNNWATYLARITLTKTPRKYTFIQKLPRIQMVKGQRIMFQPVELSTYQKLVYYIRKYLGLFYWPMGSSEAELIIQHIEFKKIN